MSPWPIGELSPFDAGFPSTPFGKHKPTTNPNLALFFSPDGRTLFFVYQLVPPAPSTAAYVDR
jgi:hypothetical protein